MKTIVQRQKPNRIQPNFISQVAELPVEITCGPERKRERYSAFLKDVVKAAEVLFSTIQNQHTLFDIEEIRQTL